MSLSRTPRAAVLGMTVGALVAGGLVLAPTASAVSPDVVINEVYGGGGNSGATLKNDFIELKNTGSAPVRVTGWSVQYASATGTSWQVTALRGTIEPGGHYLVQEAQGAGGTTDLPSPDATGAISMAAGAGRVALVAGQDALTCGATCAGSAGVVDLVGYGTTTRDAEGGAPTGNLSATASASRSAAGTDSDNNAADFTVGGPSPESDGITPEPDHCADGVIPIGQVQGDGPSTPCYAEKVTVAGTVVGDLQDTGFKGVYVQDAGDGNDATSDGIFVYTSTPLTLGDQVTVSGTVNEFDTLTELDHAAVTVTGHGDLPTAKPLPMPSSDADREALEGMLVTPATDLTVTEVYNLDYYGEVMLASGGRLITPTEIADPGQDAARVAAENKARSIVHDDGQTAVLTGQAPPYLAAGDPVRVGDTARLQPVVLSQGHGAYRLEPADGTSDGTTFDATNPRPAAPAAVGGDLRIADFNVLNYFIDFPTATDNRPRGATNAAELTEQRTKIINAITTLNPDIATLHEIENSAVLTPDTPYAAVQTVVDALNQAQGTTAWTYVHAHEDTDVITNAIIYRTDRATAIGDAYVPDDLSAFDNARSPIAQTFHSGNETFSIIANHLKSKGSSCGAASDDTSPGGAGNCNGDRVTQAHVLVDFAKTVAERSGDPDVLLTGDFNSYAHEDPVGVITGAGFTDMGPVLAAGKYSYVFDGGSGSLDHMFASPSMKAHLTGMDVWDINAVESHAYEYDGYEPLYTPDVYRASDHNPTVVGVRTDVPATAAISDAQPLRGDKVTVTGTNFTAGTTVRATLPARNGAVLGTGVADPNGTVTISFSVPVFLPQGNYPVELTAADGETASTSFTLRSVLQDVLAHLARLLSMSR
ncbi:MAG: ExeM/NucH family extracellular endonuclease [Blastococcus sp.]